MKPTVNCPSCGAVLAHASEGDVCPACLLRAAMTMPLPVTPDDPSSGQDSGFPSVAERLGARIGRYKLLEQIGEGGFGVVWMAEQDEPVRRRRGRKIIKPGMDTREVVSRFEAERQALAMMDHPNIARVFDGGTTETGRPYFVMELVRGLPITEFCDARRMPPAERLELFRKVCLAVQHAHQKGIIHRDLKPSNILVTIQDDVPVPKVIDFGIAKALLTQLTEKTLFTRFNQWLGTPAYMSPEQAGLGGLDVDTRSDIYSLGAILFELLTGHTPFDERKLREIGYDAMLRTIREEDPPKASTCLTTLPPGELQSVALHRGKTPEKLGHAIKGELDWILLKALDRDRSRRYETANALAKDLERFNTGEPVSAAPPSYVYQARKLLRKQRSLLPAALGIVLLLMAGTALLTRYIITRPRPFSYNGQPFVAALLGNKAAVVDVAYSPQQKVLASAGFDGTVRLWSAITGAPLATFHDHGPRVWAVAFTPDGETLASAGGDGRILLWDVRRRKFLRTLTANDVPKFLGTWPRGVSNLMFSPDGRTLAACTKDSSSINLWDLNSGRLTASLETDMRLLNFAFSPDGTRMAVAANEFLGIMEIQSGKRLWWQRADSRVVESLAFSPDGKTLATGNADHYARLWDAATGMVLVQLPHYHVSITTAIAYSPDGKWLASASGEHIFVWDAASHQKLARLEGHFALVTKLVFLPDGRTLVSAGEDREIKIWDVKAAIAEIRAADSMTKLVHELEPAIRSAKATNGRYLKLISEAAPGSIAAAISELIFIGNDAALIPQSDLSFHSVSSAQKPDRRYSEGTPEWSLDGNPFTWWHSRWSQPAAPFPHWIVVDLGKPHDLGGFLLRNRTDDLRHSDILNWRILISDDAQSWREVGHGNFESSADWQGAAFPKSK